MDQNNEQFRPEDQNPPPAQAGVEYYTTFVQPEEPTPKPRNKKALLISLLSAGGVLGQLLLGQFHDIQLAVGAQTLSVFRRRLDVEFLFHLAHADECYA